ncbi:MAG: tRNA (guanosine(46)-N7)-methyltransferase TrmB [Bacteroidetes bacterium]|nr:tRNA (guanosine(46)-N7)-methyltransferase TrmB [Bacteroidota bacterium]
MAKNKLKKFNQYESFPNTFDARNLLKGKWHTEVFKNTNPITVEIACGRGEYVIGLAKLYPERNFVGVDVKAARMWEGAKLAMENNLPNVAFIRIQIDFLKEYFAPREVDEIWITFPDPQPQKPREKQRLTSPRFLGDYFEILGVNKNINLKTDSDMFFKYTLEKIEPINTQIKELLFNIDEKEDLQEELKITTYYERKWRESNIPIKYLQFQFI